MEDSTNASWKNELNQLYGLLDLYSQIFLLLAAFCWASYIFLVWPYTIDTIQIVFALLQILNTSIIKIFQNSSLKLKIFVIFYYTEFLNLLCLYLSWMENEGSKMLVFFSIALTTKVQLPIIKSKILYNLDLCKSILVWYAMEKSVLQFSQLMILEFNFALGAIVILNIWHYHRMKILLDKIKLKFNVKGTKSFWKFIDEFFPDQSINQFRDKKLEFASEKTKNPLNANKKSFFSTIKLLICKKFANFLTIIKNKNKESQIANLIRNDDMKTALLRSTSHELRNLLNPIIFFTNNISEKENCQNILIEYEKLKAISVSSQLMLSLINDLLDFSKMIAGVFNMTKTKCEFKEIINKAWELMQMQCKKKDIELIIRVDEMIPKWIYTDPFRLRYIYNKQQRIKWKRCTLSDFR